MFETLKNKINKTQRKLPKVEIKKNFNFSDKRLMNPKKKTLMTKNCRVHTNVCQFDYMRPRPLSVSDPAL